MHVAHDLIYGYVGLLEGLGHIALALVAQLRAQQEREHRSGDDSEQYGSHQQLH